MVAPATKSWLKNNHNYRPAQDVWNSEFQIKKSLVTSCNLGEEAAVQFSRFGIIYAAP